MKKISLIFAALVVVSTSTFAGGLLTNTNQNVAFLRNPARDAVIDIDGVYTNPAGVAFLQQGFHLSLNWQAAMQKREMTSTFLPYLKNANGPALTKDFVGEAKAPVIPSVQAAYVINDKWSVSAQFAVGGGGGKCEFEDGIPMFEKLIGGQIANGKPYTLNQSLIGEQYFYGLQVGATYKITDNIAVFGGVRGVLANCSYKGSINGISVDGNTSESLTAMANSLSQQLANLQSVGGDAATIAALQAGITTAKTNAVALSDYTLDCKQSAVGVTPIVGIHANFGKLSLAAKYEFKTNIELENESNNSMNLTAMAATVPAVSVYADGAKVDSDIPAIATFGAQYAFTPSVRASAGFHYYFDKDCEGSATDVTYNTWEALVGAEWDINSKVTVSGGVQRTQYGFRDGDLTDTNFNINSYGLCLGAAVRLNDMLKFNVGYMHSFYDSHTVENAYGFDKYTRKNDVVGVGVDLTF